MEIAITIMCLAVSAAAFWRKSSMLHAASIMAWFILGGFMWNMQNAATNPYAGNSYLPTAVLMLALGMVIVHVASIIQGVFGNRAKPISYDDEKGEIRDKLFKNWKKKERRFRF